MGRLPDGQEAGSSMTKPLSPEKEAKVLRERYENLAACHGIIARQFDVLQTRTHMMLTLATLTLTITGFSGPKIAASCLFSRYTMVMGLVCVLVSIIVTLMGTLRIRWLTQLGVKDGAGDVLAGMIAYRNRKTRLFRVELIFLVVGLTLYVSSVVAFMLVGL